MTKFKQYDEFKIKNFNLVELREQKGVSSVTEAIRLLLKKPLLLEDNTWRVKKS